MNGSESSASLLVSTPVKRVGSSLGQWLALPLFALSACAPLFKAVPEPGPTEPLPVGPSQGPFTLTVPLDPARPHRVAVHFESRCSPLMHLELRSASRGVEKRELGDRSANASAWQSLLRQRFLGSDSPAPRAAPAAGPTPGVGVAVSGGGVAGPRGAAGGATAVATMTLPGHWEREQTFDATFELERTRRCAVVARDAAGFPEPFDAGETSLTVVLWSEVPQLLEGAVVSVEVERLDPPEPPRRDTRVPAPGATWQEGRFTWFHDDRWNWGWRWTDGEWLAPATVPPPRDERPGSPPNPGQVWATGSWHWAGRDGWAWTEGHWSVPAEPNGPPPPPRRESPSGTCRTGTWASGAWAWSPRIGWEWRDSSWREPASPTEPRPTPREERPGSPPNPGQVWAQGWWQWRGCEGWVWSGGQWAVPSKPPGPPPPAREETPGVHLCRAEVWAQGEWRWDGNVGWRWQGGRWTSSPAPTSQRPVDRLEEHGAPPSASQVWASGSWRWDGCDGWLWRAGGWVIPESPPGEPPPLRAELPGPSRCPAAVWAQGEWQWVRGEGWTWRRGVWREVPVPSSPRPTELVEQPGYPPAIGAAWQTGGWFWDSCAGWRWSRGSWRVPRQPAVATVVTPSGPAPEEEFVPMPTPAPQPVVASAQKLACKAPMTAPPGPRAETMPASPAEGSVWIPGLWAWTGCDWEWRAGRWHQPPEPGMIWAPGPTVELGRWVMSGGASAGRPVHPAVPVQSPPPSSEPSP